MTDWRSVTIVVNVLSNSFMNNNYFTTTAFIAAAATALNWTELAIIVQFCRADVNSPLAAWRVRPRQWQ